MRHRGGPGNGHGGSPDEVAEWVRKSTASQGPPEKVADPTILRKVAILMRPSLAGRSGVPTRGSITQGSSAAAGGTPSPHPAAGQHERARAQTSSDYNEGSVLAGLSDADCAHLERAARGLLRALEARRGQISRD